MALTLSITSFIVSGEICSSGGARDSAPHSLLRSVVRSERSITLSLLKSAKTREREREREEKGR